MNKSHRIDQTIKRDILADIDGDGYDETPTTTEEKRAFLTSTFQSEYGWRVEQVGRQNAVRDWLQGLQGVFHIPFANYDILQYAESIGSLPADATEKQEDKIIENYWDFMAAKVCQIMDGYRLPK